MQLRMPLVRQPEHTFEGNVHAHEKSSSNAYVNTCAGQLAGNRRAIEQGIERAIEKAILCMLVTLGKAMCKAF